MHRHRQRNEGQLAFARSNISRASLSRVSSASEGKYEAETQNRAVIEATNSLARTESFIAVEVEDSEAEIAGVTSLRLHAFYPSW